MDKTKLFGKLESFLELWETEVHVCSRRKIADTHVDARMINKMSRKALN